MCIRHRHFQDFSEKRLSNMLKKNENLLIPRREGVDNSYNYEWRLAMGGNVMSLRALGNRETEKVGRNKPGSRGQTVRRALITAGAVVGSIVLFGAVAAPLRAQPYPNKAIRFILPYPPGSTTDVVGRVIGQKLSEGLGQPVVAENRAGGGGNIGIEYAAKARPDGYTLLLATTGFSFGPSLYKRLNYDPIKDFAPISLVAESDFVLIVSASLPVKNLKDLVDYARANPGKLKFGSGGVGAGTHLTVELLKSLAKIDIVHVPYKGAVQALTGVMAGEIGMVVIGAPTAPSAIQTGKVRALAVLSKERARSLPNVPTAKESGVDNFEVTTWFGILAPAGTQRDIVNRVNATWIKTAAMPESIEKMQTTGIEPISSTPEQFSKFLQVEIVRWGKVIKEANIPNID